MTRRAPKINPNPTLKIVLLRITVGLALIATSGQAEPRLQILEIPAGLAASCAFMLPMATGPNAVVFGTGRVSMQAMMIGPFVPIMRPRRTSSLKRSRSKPTTGTPIRI